MSYEQEYAKVIAQVKRTVVPAPKAILWHRITERRQQRLVVFPRLALGFTLLLILFSGVFAAQTYQANRFVEEVTLSATSVGTFESEYVSDLLAE